MRSFIDCLRRTMRRETRVYLMSLLHAQCRLLSSLASGPCLLQNSVQFGVNVISVSINVWEIGPQNETENRRNVDAT